MEASLSWLECLLDVQKVGGSNPSAPTKNSSVFRLFNTEMVDIAQLVSASGCGPEGRRFESDYPPHTK